MRRQTFVIRVLPEGISTLEHVGTGERVAVTDLAAVGNQIQEWLERPPGLPTPLKPKPVRHRPVG